MSGDELEGALELGLIGLALVLITAPIWLPVWLWRSLTDTTY